MTFGFIQRWITSFVLAFSATAVMAESVEIAPLKGQEVLRVCADGYNLPYSNKAGEGFDNKIAEIIAEELGIPLEYYWFPQRIGFARNTLNKVDETTGRYMCDVAFNIPARSDAYLTTKPYFSSIEGMVYRSGEGYELNSMADIAKVSQELKPLRVGLFDRALPTAQLMELGLQDQLVYYRLQSGDVEENTGELLINQALRNQEIDVAIIWGPIGSYFAAESDVPMTFVPLNELTERHVFAFSAGVRNRHYKWRDVINAIFDKRRDDIEAILADYHMPKLDNVLPAPRRR